MADLFAEQARLRPALDRLLRLAAGWVDPDALVATDPEMAGAGIERAPGARPSSAPTDHTSDADNASDPSAAAAMPRSVPAYAIRDDAGPPATPPNDAERPALPRTVVAEPSGPTNEPGSALPALPCFRLAPAPRGRATAARRGIASAVLGVTASAVAELQPAAADLTRNAPSRDRRPAGALSSPSQAMSSSSSAAAFSELRGLQRAPDNDAESTVRPRRASANRRAEGRAFAAISEVDLEERIADILERAAIDAGVDLP
jgi:hypothetical protein